MGTAILARSRTTADPASCFSPRRHTTAPFYYSTLLVSAPVLMSETLWYLGWEGFMTTNLCAGVLHSTWATLIGVVPEHFFCNGARSLPLRLLTGRLGRAPFGWPKDSTTSCYISLGALPSRTFLSGAPGVAGGLLRRISIGWWMDRSSFITHREWTFSSLWRAGGLMVSGTCQVGRGARVASFREGRHDGPSHPGLEGG